MSSTNKTQHLQLNSWIGSDKPKRTDFNADNVIIDNAVYSHTSDSSKHVSASEKEVWNSPYYMSTFLGNGNSTRTIATSCPFDASFGIIFAAGKMPMMNDYANESHYNYFALFSTSGSVNGVSLSGRNLSVVQSATAVFGNEYRNFNEVGVTYVYILFR